MAHAVPALASVPSTDLKAALSRLQSLPNSSVKGNAKAEGGSASLYDHLVEVVRQVLLSDPEANIDLFSEGSVAKRTAFGLGNNDGEPKVPAAPSTAQNKSMINALKAALDAFVVEEPPINEETGEPEPREPMNEFTAADFFSHAAMFTAVGSGLSAAEVPAVCLGMTRLASDPVNNIKSVRFFGKIFAKQADYYVYETELQSYDGDDVSNLKEQVEEATMYHDRIIEASVEPPAAPEGGEGDSDGGNGDAAKDTDNNGEGGPSAPKEVIVPPEEPGTGTNEFTYWVSTSPSGSFVKLPHVLPSQIVASRSIQKIFTGDLNAEVKAATPFLGHEKHLLRAVIANIASDTVLCPNGFYTIDEESEEVQLNEEYECPENLKAPESWIHKNPSILAQGRCTFWSEPKEEDEDNEDEEEENEEAKGRDPLASIEGDRMPGGHTAEDDSQIPWTIYSHSNQPAMQHVIIAARSRLWPGALSVMNKQTFANIYVGDGISCRPFAPPMPPPLQEEYQPPAEEDKEEEAAEENEEEDEEGQDDGERQDKVKNDLILKELDDLPPKPEPEEADTEGNEGDEEDE